MEEIKQSDINALINLFNKKGYKLNTRDKEINIVGIRANTTTPNKFDDTMILFYKDNDSWIGFQFPMTTDPGTYYLKNPMSQLGAAILKAGQWKYQIGTHYTYRALVQREAVTCIRDYNRDAILDFNNGKETTGWYGINIHRAGVGYVAVDVDTWSAGCQVVQKYEDFKRLMELMTYHNDKYGKESIYYTLIDQRAYARELRRKAVYLIGAAVAGIYYYLKK